MSDLSQIPTEQLIQMLQGHVDAPEAPKTNNYKIDAPTMFASQYIPGGDYAIAGAGYLADKITHPIETAKAIAGNPDANVTSYEGELKNLRAEKDQYAKDNPFTAGVAELAGGLTNPVYNKLAGVIGDAIPGVGTLAKYTRFGAQGAGVGATAGLLDAQGQDGGLPTAGDMASGTARGAGLGLLTGIAAPVIGNVIAGGAKMVGSGVSSLLSKFDTPESQGARRLEMALMRDYPGVAPAELVPTAKSALSDLGEPATIADLRGNVGGAAEAAATRPGVTFKAAEALGDRQYGQAERIHAAALDAAGVAHKDELIAKRAVATQPMFEEAFKPQSGPTTVNSKQITSPDIEALLETPEAQKGLQSGMEDLRRESVIQRQKLDPSDYALRRNPDTGQWEKVGTPNLRMIDAVRRGWSGMLADHDNRAIWHENGTMTNEGRQTAIFLDRLVSETDAQLPKLADTGKSAWMTALKTWGEMTKPIDAVSTVERVLDKARDASDVTGRLYGSPAARAKLEGLGPADKVAQFAKVLENEKTFADTNRQLSGNSRTAFRQAAQADQDSGAGVDALLDAATNPSPGNILSKISQGVRRWARTPDPSVADSMSPLLSMDPAVRDAYLEAVNQRITGKGLVGRLSQDLSRRYGLLGSGDPFNNYAAGKGLLGP